MQRRLEFGFIETMSNGKRHEAREREREIMCEQIAINLINIFFLLVPNTSTSSMQNVNEQKTQTESEREKSVHP